MPTTLFGDLLHVFLGPFSGLLTGVLNGVLLYLLVMSLLVIYRKPGIVALMFLLKWMLAGLMFGRFTPLGILSYMVYIVVLESILYISGFYRKQELTSGYVFIVAILIGTADAFITMINLEQMMFFTDYIMLIGISVFICLSTVYSTAVLVRGLAIRLE